MSAIGDKTSKAEDPMSFHGTLLFLSDMWVDFEGRGKLRLRVAIDAQHPSPEAFVVRLADGALLHFKHLAILKGRRIYEATALHPTGSERPVESVPELDLVGPHRKGATDG